MQSDEAGMPTDKAMMIRLADNGFCQLGPTLTPNIMLRTDVTPNRSQIDCGMIPYDRVDEGVQTTQTRPKHVYACARVPSYNKQVRLLSIMHRVTDANTFKMPGEWNAY